MKTKNDYIRIIVLILIIFIFIVLLNYMPIYDKDEIMLFLENVRQSTNAGIIFIITTIVLTVFFVPISWFIAAGAVLFGLPRGFIYSLTAATTAAVISFLITKVIQKDSIEFIYRRLYKRNSQINLKRMMDNLNKHGLRYMFLLRNVPFVPFTMLNYLSGVTTVSLKDFALGSFLGMIPGIFISTFFYTKALDFRNDPQGAAIGFLIKVSYFIVIFIWHKKTKHNID